METAPLKKGEQTRQRILEEALRLITVKGYHHTSMNDIIESTGIKKGNLYFHFPSKDDLICELIARARIDYGQYLRKHIQGRGPMERLSSMLQAVRRFHARFGFVGGCIFGNMALEMGDESPRVAQLVREVFEEWGAMIRELVQGARDAGEVPASVNPDAAARMIIATLEGAVMMAKLTKDESDFRAICDSLIVMLRK
ncbi:MAG: TetR/AcrR family transcriptional regulator [Spirochaetes bacterium]|nr:TetR/AcrR family transcriptional regulator [Spirochaetota bacterium]